MATPLGTKVRALRHKTQPRLTVEQLAHRVGCHRNTLERIELGIQEPTIPTIVAIAEALDVDVRVLIRLAK